MAGMRASSQRTLYYSHVSYLASMDQIEESALHYAPASIRLIQLTCALLPHLLELLLVQVLTGWDHFAITAPPEKKLFTTTIHHSLKDCASFLVFFACLSPSSCYLGQGPGV